MPKGTRMKNIEVEIKKNWFSLLNTSDPDFQRGRTGGRTTRGSARGPHGPKNTVLSAVFQMQLIIFLDYFYLSWEALQ